MVTCKTCRYWNADWRCTQPLLRTGETEIPDRGLVATPDFGGVETTVYTGPDFGCVNGEELTALVAADALGLPANPTHEAMMAGLVADIKRA